MQGANRQCLNCRRRYYSVRVRDDGYCDRFCRAEGEYNRMKQCRCCGRQFSLKQRGAFNRHYCSKECTIEKTKLPQASSVKKRDHDLWAKEVKERAGFRCEFPHDSVPEVPDCLGVLDAHHVRPKSLFPEAEVRYDSDNGLAVCRTSHRWIDRNPKESERLGLRVTQRTVDA